MVVQDDLLPGCRCFLGDSSRPSLKELVKFESFKEVEHPFKDVGSYSVVCHTGTMSMRNKVVIAGVLGLVLALGLIVGSTYFVQSPSPATTPNQTVTSTLTLTQTINSGSGSQSQTQSAQASQSQSQSSQSPTSQSQTSQSSPPSNAGTVDVLLTDPPTLPAGVTAVFVTYSNVAVHVRGAGNQSGWTNSNTAGTLNLVKLVNVSSTIATIKVSTGVYNELRFNISSAAVTFNGKNYTAFVQGAELTVPIPGESR